MMLTPWGPRAVPTGGAGVAAPACSCTLTSAAIFFLGGIRLVPFWVVRRGHHEPTGSATWGVAVFLRFALSCSVLVWPCRAPGNRTSLGLCPRGSEIVRLRLRPSESG